MGPEFLASPSRELLGSFLAQCKCPLSWEVSQCPLHLAHSELCPGGMGTQGGWGAETPGVGPPGGRGLGDRTFWGWGRVLGQLWYLIVKTELSIKLFPAPRTASPSQPRRSEDRVTWLLWA